MLRYRIELHWSNLKAAQGIERLDYIREKSKEVKKRTKGITMTKLRRIKGVLEYLLLPRAIRDVQKAGLQANSTYVPKPYDVKVALFRATEQPHGIYPDRTNGWDKFALGGVDVYDVPGHHGAIMFEPRVKVLAQTLTSCLNAAQANASSRKHDPIF